jgi:quinol monooxygenase YgiN
MIIVLASIDLNPGTREHFLAEFHKIVPQVLAEQGCIEYYPHTEHASDLPGQGMPNENLAVIVEKWETIEHLKAHLAAPHMLAYRPKVKDFVKQVRLQILEPAKRGS